MTINKDIIGKIQYYLDLLIGLNVKNVMFGLAVPLGRMVENQDKFKLKEQDFQDFLNLLDEYRENYKDIINISPIKNITNIKKRNTKILGCQAGKTNVAITETGLVVPCHMMPRDSFEKYTLHQYFDDIDNGITHIDTQAVSIIEHKLDKTGNNVTDLLCNGFCDFGG